MSGWRVDPDGVVGVLAGVGDEARALDDAVPVIDEIFLGAPAVLGVGGRTAVVQAWGAFFEERRFVPSKLSVAVCDAASGVSEATVAVVVGDACMASDSAQAQSYAMAWWGLDSGVSRSGSTYLAPSQNMGFGDVA